jgi:hypothetical protein
MVADDARQDRPTLKKSSRDRRSVRSQKKASERRQKLRVEMGKYVLKVVLLGLLFCAFYVTLFSGGQPPVPVTGVVTYNDEPVANVNVICLGRRNATGTTDEQGRFSSLTTQSPDDGAFPGEYRVAITPATTPAEASDPSTYAPPTQPAFPARYLSAETSGLSITVEKSGTNHFHLQLKDGP